jgi:hypothetical protein
MRRLIERIRSLPNPGRLLMDKMHGMPDPSPRDDRTMMLLGHYGIFVLGAYAAYDIWDDLAGQPHGWPRGVLSVFVVAFIACWYSEMRWHGRRLCERCARQSPIDPDRAVRRWRPALRWAHMERAHKACLAVYLALVMTELAWNMDGYRRYADIAVVSFIVFTWVIQRAHSALQPWCPWCDWGEGGDEEVFPEVPDPALSK